MVNLWNADLIKRGLVWVAKKSKYCVRCRRHELDLWNVTKMYEDGKLEEMALKKQKTVHHQVVAEIRLKIAIIKEN
jgi:hypothetical protein